MAISEAARKNHGELFPAHGSTLKITDPELTEYFDNFAFDEVLRYGSLNTRTRLMVQLASLIACPSVGLDAAHVRWFAFDGPDDLDNGLALCVLHHKLFDLGVLGLDAAFRVLVSATFSVRTAGRAYGLHGHELHPRPGTVLPGLVHVAWHTREVFKGAPLAA